MLSDLLKRLQPKLGWACDRLPSDAVVIEIRPEASLSSASDSRVLAAATRALGSIEKARIKRDDAFHEALFLQICRKASQLDPYSMQVTNLHDLLTSLKRYLELIQEADMSGTTKTFTYYDRGTRRYDPAFPSPDEVIKAIKLIEESIPKENRKS